MLVFMVQGRFAYLRLALFAERLHLHLQVSMPSPPSSISSPTQGLSYFDLFLVNIHFVAGDNA